MAGVGPLDAFLLLRGAADDDDFTSPEPAEPGAAVARPPVAPAAAPAPRGSAALPSFTLTAAEHASALHTFRVGYVSRRGGRLSTLFAKQLGSKSLTDYRDCGGNKPVATFAAFYELLDIAGGERGWINMDGPRFMELVFEGRFVCDICRGASAKQGGKMWATKDTVSGHLIDASHVGLAATKMRQASAAAAVVATKAGMGVAASVATEDLVKMAVVANAVSLHVPYTRLEHVLSADQLRLASQMHGSAGGMPSTERLRNRYLPGAVAIIKESMLDDYVDLRVSVTSDKGSTDLMRGKEVLMIHVSNPALAARLKQEGLYSAAKKVAIRGGEEIEEDDEEGTGEFLLAAHVLTSSINAVQQADILRKVLKEFGIKLMQVMWFCGDNEALNPATARLLGVPFANCLPHSLNLGLEAFMSAFKLPRQVCYFRTFIKQGGSMFRRALLEAHGLRLSSFDYSETRWQGLLETIVKLADDLNPREVAAMMAMRTKNAAELQRLKETVRRTSERQKKAEEKGRAAAAAGGYVWTGVTKSVDSDSDSDDDDDDDDDIPPPLIAAPFHLDIGDEVVAAEVGDASPGEAEEGGAERAPAVRKRVWVQLGEFIMDTTTADEALNDHGRVCLEILHSWEMLAEAHALQLVVGDLPRIISMAEGANGYKGGENLYAMATTHVKIIASMVPTPAAAGETAAAEAAAKEAAALSKASAVAVAAQYADLALAEVRARADEYADTLTGDLRFAFATNIGGRLQKTRKYLVRTIMEGARLYSAKLPAIRTALARLHLRELFSFKKPLPDFGVLMEPFFALVSPLFVGGAAALRVQEKNELHKEWMALRSEVVDVCTSASPMAKDMRACPYEWLVTKLKQWPHIVPVALRAVCAPISSVAPERANSIMRKISALDRMSMKELSFSHAIFLAANRVLVQRLVRLALHRVELKLPPLVTLPVAQRQAAAVVRAVTAGTKLGAGRQKRKRDARDEREGGRTKSAGAAAAVEDSADGDGEDADSAVGGSDASHEDR